MQIQVDMSLAEIKPKSEVYITIWTAYQTLKVKTLQKFYRNTLFCEISVGRPCCRHSMTHKNIRLAAHNHKFEILTKVLDHVSFSLSKLHQKGSSVRFL